MSTSSTAFDIRSGSKLERAVFNNRLVFLFLCVCMSILAALSARHLVVNSAFDKMIPRDHESIRNYFDNRDKLGGLGNVVRVVVENPKGDIFDAGFLDVTRRVNDQLFLMPGVDRAWMKSIWMSSVRWTEVTEEGFRGGAVMPADYDGGTKSLEKLRNQIRMSGILGSLVSNDSRSLMIVVPLLEVNPETRAKLDYAAFASQLEKEIRQRYEADSGGASVRIHIVGFAKLTGDLIDGLREMLWFFAAATATAAILIFAYTRCVRSTLLVIGCSLIAVLWELGIISSLGFQLDPYSTLVPFLVFAIGVSHGAQKMNGIMQDVGRGASSYVAARLTFRRLFLAGLTALLADAVGFGVLMLIDIPVIKDLAVTASIGVAVLIVTNLLLLPVLLCYVGMDADAARRSVSRVPTASRRDLAFMLSGLAERRSATIILCLSAVLALFGYGVSTRLQVGDLDPGAPELRPDARYNRDVKYINSNYGMSSDQFVVIVKTSADGCSSFKALRQTERLAAILRELPGVKFTTSLPDSIANVVSGLNEGNAKWLSVSRNERLVGGATQWILTDSPDMVDKACSVSPLTVYLADHKAGTLKRVVRVVNSFAAENSDSDVQFLLAAGPAGIEAITNEVVERASRTMLLYVYGAVALLCLVTFRSWRAVLVAVIPLALTSVLCEALMVSLGMGVKVATLPVIALGVGIGIDYALYLLSVQLTMQRNGLSLREAYLDALRFTGRVVALVGVTLAAGVITWAWSPIKFQADMGILLAFMFLWNMLGALVLIPALSHFLLPSGSLVARGQTPTLTVRPAE